MKNAPLHPSWVLRCAETGTRFAAFPLHHQHNSEREEAHKHTLALSTKEARSSCGRKKTSVGLLDPSQHQSFDVLIWERQRRDVHTVAESRGKTLHSRENVITGRLSVLNFAFAIYFFEEKKIYIFVKSVLPESGIKYIPTGNKKNNDQRNIPLAFH